MAQKQSGGTSGATALSDGGRTPYPLAARVCIAMGWIQIVASALVSYWYGTGPLMDSVDPEEVRHFYHAKLMLVPAMLLETAQVLTSRTTDSDVALHGAEMSLLVVVEYMVKMAAYSYMAAYSGGVVHQNLLASGPARGCYSMRYLEWSIAVPTLLAINNYPLAGQTPAGQFTRRLLPSLFATWAYILASWLAQVTPNSGCGWFLVLLAAMAYTASIWDQVDIVRETDPQMHAARFKIGAVVFKEVVFTVYGAVYLLGAGNFMSSLSEQMFYTYGDVMLKVTQASILVVVRNWDDLAMLQRVLRRQVQTGREDMSRLFRSSMAPIFSISEEGFVMAWNEHLASTSGISEAEAVGRSILELIDPGSKENMKHAMKTCWAGLASGAVEVVLRRQSEEQLPVQMSLTLVMQHGSGPVSSILAIGQDLTELAAMKATQERKARFTAVLGHELRSPLHGIIGLSASMAQNAQRPGNIKQLNMIKGCATRLLDLVTNIMEIAKAEKIEASSDHALCVKPVNVMDLAEEVLGMTELAVDKRGCNLVGDGVTLINGMRIGELPLVMGDSYKITQLLYNLVTNAAKFTSQGHIRLAAREDQAKSMLEIDVEDTGRGISPDALSKIFEPFHQETGQDARGFQGVGLGLSVAQSVAALHGGSIRVASVVGQGSTFTVCLPCDLKQRAGLSRAKEEKEPDTKEAEPKEADARDSEASGSEALMRRVRSEPAARKPSLPLAAVSARAEPPPLLLSVDDDEINQEVIEQSLGSSYRVVRAMNGSEALAYLDSGAEHPSIVLLDIMMPGMTGFEVAQEIRGRRCYSHVQLPVIMLSARAPQDATARLAYDAGATDFMTKPFSGAVLQQRLAILATMCREALAGPASPGHSPALAAPPPVSAPVLEEPPPAVEQQLVRDAGQQTEPVAPPTPPRVSEAVARLEEMEALRRERDGFKARLEAAQAEAAAAAQALRRLEEEERERQDTLRDWRCSPRQPQSMEAIAATTMGSLAMAGSRSWDSIGPIVAPADEVCAAEYPEYPEYPDVYDAVDFYKAEVARRSRDIATLTDKLAAQKSAAWLERQRAEALTRELRLHRGRATSRRAY